MAHSPDAVLCTPIAYTADNVKRTSIHVYLCHWPGLRLSPPFYLNLITLQPVPSFSCSKKTRFCTPAALPTQPPPTWIW